MIFYARKPLLTYSIACICTLAWGCGDDGEGFEDGSGTATGTGTGTLTTAGNTGMSTTTTGSDTGSTGDTGGTTTGDDPDFGTPQDVQAAETMWNEILNYRQWPEFPGAHGILPSEGPHGPFVRFYINSLDTNNANELRDGSIIVKENFATVDENTLGAVTVMKRVAGFNPAAGDWFWVKYMSDGSLDMTPTGVKMAGKVDGCISCHTNAGANDFVFINDPPEFGTAQDQATATALWQEMGDYRQWANFPGKVGIVAGGAPHGEFVRFYVNTIAAADTQNLADGSIVVKENFATQDEATLGAITVAKKIAGFDPGAKDWFWVKYLPGGSLDQSPTMVPLAGKVSGCISCHSAAAGDYIFANDAP